MIIHNEKPLSQIKKEKEEAASPLASMGQEIVQLKLQNMQKDMVIQALGQQVAMTRIEMMKLRGGE